MAKSRLRALPLVRSAVLLDRGCRIYFVRVLPPLYTLCRARLTIHTIPATHVYQRVGYRPAPVPSVCIIPPGVQTCRQVGPPLILILCVAPRRPHPSDEISQVGRRTTDFLVGRRIEGFELRAQLGFLSTRGQSGSSSLLLLPRGQLLPALRSRQRGLSSQYLSGGSALRTWGEGEGVG